MTTTTLFITRAQVVTLLRLDDAFLRSLEDEEIIRPSAEGYCAEDVERARLCHTLHNDLRVNFPGLEVALKLLETIEAERKQIRELLALIQNERRDSAG